MFPTKEDAIGYGQTRARFRTGEIRVLDSTGNVVIPRGTPAMLVVRRMTEGGTLSSGSYVLDLDSVQVNGRRRGR